MEKYIGKILDDRYEIIDLIGVGGMSYVYRAKCKRLSRYVAIKILKDEFANDAEFKKRFRNESDAVARMNHKNIVNVFDVSNNSNIEYIVMELIEGISLKEFLENRGKLDWKEARFFAYQIAEGLDHAHKRGIIHQDIKPHNIMLLRDGTIKVADFGIAKLENDGETKVIREAIGSVHYISPEQARGSTIDHRTDIYSLGIVMYEMVTGSTPYKGDTAISIVMQHINSMPAPPSLMNTAVPKSFEYIILKAMKPSLKNRYESAIELLVDLEKIKSNPNIVFSEQASYDDEFEKTQQINSEEVRNAVISDRNTRYEAIEQVRKPKKEKKTSKKYDEYEDDDDDYKEKSNGLAIFITVLLVLGLVAGAVNFAINQVFKQEVQVMYAPDLVDLTYDRVTTNSSFNTYNIEIIEELYSEKQEGTIISQDPLPNTSITQNTTINVTVSLGLKKETMPNLVEYEFAQADTYLKRMGIENIKFEYDFDDEISEGKVIKTSPISGEDITSASSIIIYVSAGKEKQICTIPNLRGLTTSQAQKALEEIDLVLGQVTEQESLTGVGEVIAQGMQFGTEVISGTAVNIVIGIEPVIIEEEKPIIKTKTVSIHIPEDETGDSEAEVFIEIFSENELIYEKMHSNFGETIDLEISGEDSATIYVFLDGELIQERIEVFGEN